MKVIIVTGLFCFFIIKIKFLKDNSIFKTQELVLMNNDKRDNFTNAVKNKLAKRVIKRRRIYLLELLKKKR